MALPPFCRCAGCRQLYFEYDDDLENSFCEDCVAFEQLRCSTVGRHLATRFDGLVANEILEFCSPKNVKQHFRCCVLRVMLLGKPYTWNVFYNLFTYGGNGIAGTISTNEDIVDRVISFVY